MKKVMKVYGNGFEWGVVLSTLKFLYSVVYYWIGIWENFTKLRRFSSNDPRDVF